MKAKEWYRKFEACENEEQFQQELDTCLRSLVKEANDLITKRKCKSNDAMAACINEINQKWAAIRNIHYKKASNPEWFHPVLSRSELLEDGFKAAYVQLHPKNAWFFDIGKHKKIVEERQEEIEFRKKAIENFAPYPVTPFEELTMETLPKEIMYCLYALGQYYQVGLPIDCFRPLAHRISLLRYWINKGRINLGEVEEFNKDMQAWVNAHANEIGYLPS